MDIRIKFLRPTHKEALSGQVVGTDYADAGACWAQRPTSSAKLIAEAGELFEDHSATYWIRWGVEVSQGWRVIDPDGITYQIDTVQRERRLGRIILNCTRVNND